MTEHSILVLYDQGDKHPLVSEGQSLSAECYSPETASFMAQLVNETGFSTVLADDVRRVMALAGSSFPSVFSAAVNLATGLPTPFRAAQAATLFEMMRLPYTGSDPQSLLLCRDKALSKRVAEATGVPVPKGVVVTADTMHLVQDIGPGIGPVFVKPNTESSSLGIENNLFKAAPFALPLVKVLLKSFPEGVLIEQFISGLELTVVVVGNPPDHELMPLIMRQTDGASLPHDFVRDYHNKMTNNRAFQTAWFRADSFLSATDLRTLADMAQTLVSALKLRDFSRLDFRRERDGRLVFIEANGQPSLSQGNSFSNRINALYYGKENELERHFIRKSFCRLGLLEKTQ